MRVMRAALAFAVLAVIAPVEASAQDNYCSRWNRAGAKPGLQRVAMEENVKKLDASKVDRSCLMGQVDALVRWANRMCSGGGLTDEQFSLAFVGEARKRCP